MRYGRATLTIRRWGGLSELFDSPLSQVLREYRESRASASDVASAFVTARVVEHSPTFSWEAADPNRVLEMVVGCSTEPTFESADPGHVADQLLKARDQERAELTRIFAQAGGSARHAVGMIDQLANRFTKMHESVAAQYAGMLRNMVGAVALENASRASRVVAAMPRLDLELRLSKISMDAMSQSSLAGIRFAKLNLQGLGVAPLTSALTAVAVANPSVSIPGTLWRAAEKQDLRVDQVLDATRSAAELAGATGDDGDADVLSKAAADADAVISSPAEQTILAAIERLLEMVERNEQRRTEDQRSNENTLLLTTIVGWLLALYLSLLPYFTR